MKPIRVALLPFVFSLLVFETARGQGFPNVPRTPGELLTPLLEPNQGRTAVIAFHNGLLYTAPESPASQPGSDILARRWDISDLSNIQIEVLGVSPQPLMAHGYVKIGANLVLGSNWPPEAPWSFEAVAPGVTNRTVTPDLQGVFTRGDLYQPWFVSPSYWSYSGNTDPLQLSLRGMLQAEWDHLGDTGVIGHPFIVGNVLIMASDQSRTGVATYDISDPTNPQLLDVLQTGGPGGYWPEIYGADGQLFLVFPYRTGGNGIRVVDVTDPADLQFVADVPLPGAECMYAQFQDEYCFTGSHKVDMRTLTSVLSLDVTGNSIDTSQFLLPIGNLLATGGSGPNQGLAIWAHQAEPDTRGPSVGYHIPRAGQTNYPVGLPISLLIHETLESATIEAGVSFIVRPQGGAQIPGEWVLAFNDTLTFTPDNPLLPDTTYEVVIPAGGIEDVAGNGIDAYAFSFSTGANVSGNAPPALTSFTVSAYPAAPGELLTFDVTGTDPDGDALEYRFDFGDGSPKTAWGPATSIENSYPVDGHYQAKVQARDPSGTISTRALTVTVTTAVAGGPRPVSSGPIVCDENARRIWVVNPDNDTVTAVNADTLAVEFEAPVGADPRSVAIDGNGNAWITCHDADRIDIISPAGASIDQIALDYGDAPLGIVMAPDHSVAWVSLLGSGEVIRILTATGAETGSIPLGPDPRALVLSADGNWLYVSRFISPREHAEIWEVDTTGLSLSRTLMIHKFGGDEHRDGTAEGMGVANYLTGLAISPDGQQLLVASNKMNTDKGAYSGLDLDQDNTVRNLVSIIDLPSGQLIDALDIDNSDSAHAIAFSPLGDYFFVALQGNNEVAIFDKLAVDSEAGLGGFVTRRSVGRAPQGICVDSATNRVIVKDFLDRSVTALELGGLFQSGAVSIGSTAVPTVALEQLAPEILAGKRTFYDASDPRMSAEGYMSCATCHLDGGHDGRTWDFTGRGEGLRNTIPLRGRSGMGHGAVHWSANFDEIQDFEHDIRGAFGGTGFLTDDQFAGPAGTPLGAPKAGLNADLDALAAYVASLSDETIPRSPHRETNGSLSAAAQAGLNVFTNLNCQSCHSGEPMTDSAMHDVGTLRGSSGQRLGAALSGIDTPTLRGLWNSAPYFHDGSAETLEEVFSVAGGTNIPVESGILSGGAQVRGGMGAFINYDDIPYDGAIVRMNGASEATFNNVDGGSGGIGAVELRYSASGVFPVTIRVNGVDHAAFSAPAGNVPTWRHTKYLRLRVENVAFQAGATNTVEIITTDGLTVITLDDMVISNGDDLALAQPHRQVTGIPEIDRDNLLAYLRELDSSPVGEIGPPPPPAITVTPPANGTSSAATVSFDVLFSRAVTGFEAADVAIGGTALPQNFDLVEVNPGISYRVDVTGMQSAGTITMQIADGAAADLDGVPTDPVPLQVVDWAPFVDDLAPLSDEFDDAGTLGNWFRLNDVEGWNADKLEVHDINISAAGRMRLMPHTTSWYMDMVGPLAFKEVSGDFVVTLHMNAQRRDDQPGRPVGTFSLGGIMIRSPRPISDANPNPEAAPGAPHPWPPAGYATDWTPDGENYIFLSYGNTDGSAAPDQWNYEVKTTINGNSDLYFDDEGVPAGTGVVTLQAIRMGSTFVVMRKHPGGDWIIENRFDRPDMPDTLQVGITTYTDWGNILGAPNNLFQGPSDHAGQFHHNHNVISAANGFAADPDLVVDAEYFRYARPPGNLTEGDLQALPLTSDGAGIQFLDATPLAGVLGDAINQPHVPPAGPVPPDPPTGIQVTGEEFGVTISWDPVPGAAEYAILRNTIAGPGGSIEVSRVDGVTGSYLDDTAISGTGYFYSVLAIGPEGIEGELSGWNPGQLSTEPDFFPDALIGKKTAARIGGGIFNASGAGQTIRLKSPRRKALRFFVGLVNKGTKADVFKVGGTPKNRDFRVKYVENLAGGGQANVSGAVASGGFSPELESGEGVELTAIIRRRGPRSHRWKRRTFRVTVVSGNLASRRDVVRAKVESR